MGTFIERLEEELKELLTRSGKLNDFLNSEKVKEIDPVQVTLLNIQIAAMNTYAQCLTERLVRLK